MITIPFKRGDTFRLFCAYTNDDPVVFPTGIMSDVRDKQGALVAALTVENIDADAKTYELHATDATDDWPLGLLQGDILYQYAGGDQWHTDEEYVVHVREPVTHG